MMSETKSKRFALSEKHRDYIADYCVIRNLPDHSTALKIILDEHEQLKAHTFNLNYIVNSMKQEIISAVNETVHNEIKEELKRVRLGTNNTDRNSQILIELLANALVHIGVENAFDTKQVNFPVLKEAEQIVKTRIDHLKQKKDDKLT